ncbi:hypothetical protein DPEC_G00353390 [Dallia pectoralis]|uniref:Uncharacterized protein n=1 Tax=Dallia pectoralis TaxID=75939 RepID=A0ACC2F2H6_DALPE|nr:hypothetical protein DPEC_G00353390 [Dallia pectoralis]
MNRAALLMLTAVCSCVTSAIYLPNRQAPKKLKYLLEPPVYAEITGQRGGNTTLPCLLKYKPDHYKVKWTKLEPASRGSENIVIITNGETHKPYGPRGQRASLRKAHDLDASLRLSNLELEDDGSYRWMVFPYRSKNGRYKFNYQEAKEACAEQDGTLATFKQLYRAWTEGLDWCNAGWLNDGTVQYPILRPRAECGGELLPGIRTYGTRNRIQDHFDAFCFTSISTGVVFFVEGPLTFGEAVEACGNKGAVLVLVGQLYSAWHFRGYDQCDGGWLRDGSVRYPITTTREHCGGTVEAGVRTFGYPDQNLRLYGAYCYR